MPQESGFHFCTYTLPLRQFDFANNLLPNLYLLRRKTDKNKLIIWLTINIYIYLLESSDF
jgi:hypothetical protein